MERLEKQENELYETLQNVQKRIDNNGNLSLYNNLEYARRDLAAFYVQHHAQKVIDFMRAGK